MRFSALWKRLAAALSVLALLATALCAVTPLATFAAIMGDLDGNGAVNARDAKLLYQYVGRRTALSETQLAVADVDGVVGVNMRDALRLFRAASGKEPLAPPVAEDTLTPITLDRYYGRSLLVQAGETAMVEAYDALGEAITNFRRSIDLYDYRLNDLQAYRLIRYYQDDHPEAFWLDGYSSLSYGSNWYVRSISISYRYNADEAAALKAQLETDAAALLDGVTDKMPPIEREKIVHDRLVRGADYDQSLATEHAHDLLGVISFGTGVCESYARAFQYLMQRAGVPAALVVGYANGGGHMWNVVQLDGEWYQVDVTWNDPILSEPDPNFIRYDYFNITTAALEKNHVIDDTFYGEINGESIFYPTPECTAVAALWPYYSSVAVSAYDEQLMGEALAKAMQNDECVYFRAVGDYSPQQLKDDLFENGYLWDILYVAENILGKGHASSISYYPYENDELGIYGLRIVT